MTTQSLEDYLAGDYHRDMDDIRALEETIERTANVFIYTCSTDGRWPYEYSGDEPQVHPDRPSHGTQAMIAASLAKVSGLSRLASHRPARLKYSCLDDVRVTEHLGMECLIKAIRENGGKLHSGSYGENDPITLSHAIDLLAGMKGNEASLCGELKAALKSAIEELGSITQCDPGTEELLDHLTEMGKRADPDGGKKYLRNAFVPLRIARIVKACESDEPSIWEAVPTTPATGKKKTKADAQEPVQPEDRAAAFHRSYRRFFETRLHEHLSFSDIPDSRFDPAELIFCLEGLMLIAPKAVDERLFERVFKVLEQKQEESAHWRPNRPIYATPQGMTMLPISAEGAISLLRSVSLIDLGKDYQPISARAVPMVRRFWNWLQARTVHVHVPRNRIAAHDDASRTAAGITSEAKPDEHDYHRHRGWHSEHVNKAGLIQLWVTSQVLEFMLGYRELLQRSVAGRTLRLSRLKIDRQERKPRAKWNETWPGIVKGFDPRPGEPPEAQVYEKVGTSFIERWATDRPDRSYSMLLYGPPGTGKSSMAENIADALGMRMVTVTVSDFLGRGGAQVEARVKAIFQTLDAQFDTVILFDEIDSFLLDRDSERYGKQDTLFQFLTPGMLTKINDLRKAERSIFIIATNYANRIDPAIKRKGRIDRHYLLSLPNKERRLAIIKRESGISNLSKGFTKRVAEKSLFFGYSDIKNAVAEAGGKGASEKAILEKLSDPDGRPQTYDSYLKRVGEEAFPYEELIGLAKLKREVIPTYRIANLINDYQARNVGDNTEAKRRIKRHSDELRKAWAEMIGD